MPKIYILILNWDGYNDTVECIESLRSITYINYKVLVIDNNSKNNDSTLLKNKFGNYIEVIRNKENYGFAKGNNIGIEFAIKDNADYILLLNNDTVVDRDFLTQIVKSIEKYNAGMAAGKMLNYYNKNLIDQLWIEVTLRGSFEAIGHGKNDFSDSSEKLVFGPTGGFALYKVDMLKDLYSRYGYYFDEDLFAYCEDVDIAWRAQYLGWKCIYNPKAIAYHKHSRSFGKNSKMQSFLIARNHVLIIYKNFLKNLFLKNICSILFTQILMLDFRYNTFATIKGQIAALLMLNKYKEKRFVVKQNIMISNNQIVSLLNSNEK